MNYQQTIEYLYSQLPIFQRIGAAAYKADLSNTIALCDLLSNPQNNFKAIHIAGTNGKGSTSHLLASILYNKGLKTGLYTSPHLKDYRERIRIDGKKIPKTYVSDFVEKYKPDFEKIKPSFFEMTFSMAMQYFSDEKVDIAIIETGMGGRLDSTNIINPLLSVITNIGFDHSQFLGDSVLDIASEKAGIIKPNVPVVIGERQDNIEGIFEDKAELEGAPIYFADDTFEARNVDYTGLENFKLKMDIWRNDRLFLENLRCPLLGNYQSKNIVTVFQVIELLKQLGFDIRKNQMNKGVNNVIRQTELLGRWQQLSKSPLTVCDIAHNVDALSIVVEQIRNTKHNDLHFVLGVVNDKNIDDILKLLPTEAKYYFCKADIPRGLDQEELLQAAKIAELNGETYPSVKSAFDAAQQNASEEDMIFVGGSAFVVAEVL